MRNTTMSKRKADESKRSTAAKRAKSSSSSSSTAAASVDALKSILPTLPANPVVSVEVWRDYIMYVAYKWMLGPVCVNTTMTAQSQDTSVADVRRAHIRRTMTARLMVEQTLPSLMPALVKESPLFQWAACAIHMDIATQKRSRDHIVRFAPNAYAFYWRDVNRVPVEERVHMPSIAGEGSFEEFAKSLRPSFAGREFVVSKELAQKLQRCVLLATLPDLVDLLMVQWLAANKQSEPWFMRKLDLVHMDHPFSKLHHAFLKTRQDLLASAAAT